MPLKGLTHPGWYSQLREHVNVIKHMTENGTSRWHTYRSLTTYQNMDYSSLYPHCSESTDSLIHLILVISTQWACRRLAAVVRLRDFHLVQREGAKEWICSHKAWRYMLEHGFPDSLCLSRSSLQFKRHWSDNTRILEGLIYIGMAYNTHLIIKILIPRIWNLH